MKSATTKSIRLQTDDADYEYEITEAGVLVSNAVSISSTEVGDATFESAGHLILKAGTDSSIRLQTHNGAEEYLRSYAKMGLHKNTKKSRSKVLL